jgi:NDP-sugar pyrophosphorylase family protein
MAAARLFKKDGPFFLHNVDVLSNIPLDGLMAEHRVGSNRWGGEVVASLAVRSGSSSRQLLFDDRGLMGWENRASDRAPAGTHRARAPVGELRRWSFTGIHVLAPSVFQLCSRAGKFSIISLYLDLASQGRVILPLDVSAHDWIDVGTPDRLEEANRWAASLGMAGR